ncbi:hypothetical protein GKE82_24205 [Conexibacter sp. W3-3-2]|uniref:hypothetical protein n=1 Tax=Conexibacter sp. W3-3-2 TaxID=2675227 RepID=UPI0012B94C36|nr:hypothetical protein [Conexibacter sp. W3-3-2]MTD47312.1 hypothetical protein [Conexibacter sp. W3-3-2]
MVALVILLASPLGLEPGFAADIAGAVWDLFLAVHDVLSTLHDVVEFVRWLLRRRAERRGRRRNRSTD